MLTNIIDRRRDRLRWRSVRATIAPAHLVTGADAGLSYETADPAPLFSREHRDCSVAEAVAWAAERPYAATLYLDDADLTLVKPI